MNRRILVLIVDIVIGVVIGTALLFSVRGCGSQTPAEFTPGQAVSASAPVDRPIAVTGLVGEVQVAGGDRADLVLTDLGRDPARSPKLAVVFVGPMRAPITDGATATFYGSLNSDKVLHADKYTLK
jgi:cytochrome c-type biogenesis protein CcmE